MGCEVELVERGLTVRGPERLAGVDIDLHDESELTPTVAALAALADGPTRIRGRRRTSAGTRRTGSPRSSPRSTRSAVRRRRPRTAW